MQWLPMGDCSIGSSFFRAGTKRYKARLMLSLHLANWARQSSMQSIDRWPSLIRVLPTINALDTRAQLCGPAAELDDCTSGTLRIGLPPAMAEELCRYDRVWHV